MIDMLKWRKSRQINERMKNFTQELDFLNIKMVI